MAQPYVISLFVSCGLLRIKSTSLYYFVILYSASICVYSASFQFSMSSQDFHLSEGDIQRIDAEVTAYLRQQRESIGITSSKILLLRAMRTGGELMKQLMLSPEKDLMYPVNTV